MVNSVNKEMAGRINQYVEYRRKAESTSSDFSRALNGKIDEESASTAVKKPQKVASQTGGAVKRHSRRTSGGNGQAVASHRSQTSMKHITTIQAKRLAQYAPSIQAAAREHNVPVELVCAVILQESGGNYKAVSHCGARGLMQLMPATAKRLGVKNSFDPHANIMGGTKYIRMLLDRFDGNVSLALAGYNAGEGNVEKYGRKIPPFKETRAYVPSVLKYADSLWAILRGSSHRADIRPTVVHNSPVVPNIPHRTIFVSTRRA